LESFVVLTGYDVIIDEDLKPWLLEVNASPSLTANTKEDYAMKTEMLHGMLDIVDMEGFLQVCWRTIYVICCVR
jgi:hypothetical protein